MSEESKKGAAKELSEMMEYHSVNNQKPTLNTKEESSINLMENEPKKIDEPTVTNRTFLADKFKYEHSLAGKLDFDYRDQSILYLESIGYVVDSKMNRQVLHWGVGIACAIFLLVYFTSSDDGPNESEAMEKLCDRLSFMYARNPNFYGQCIVSAQAVYDENYSVSARNK